MTITEGRWDAAAAARVPLGERVLVVGAHMDGVGGARGLALAPQFGAPGGEGGVRDPDGDVTCVTLCRPLPGPTQRPTLPASTKIGTRHAPPSSEPFQTRERLFSHGLFSPPLHRVRPGVLFRQGVGGGVDLDAVRAVLWEPGVLGEGPKEALRGNSGVGTADHVTGAYRRPNRLTVNTGVVTLKAD
ncbi:hypothetical protein [Streptomyces tropicalis]|uniref:Uncharacterized protein n=1 Tax=Streptomyces tropicalis TaxID=3034234 RepID=A0ABT6A6A6_9ACTN|nr:hypothetical protein [Streptomyces tropicalis]MDF3300180.1 hypothetical protein [Streptomyces tropicalis]